MIFTKLRCRRKPNIRSSLSLSLSCSLSLSLSLSENRTHKPWYVNLACSIITRYEVLTFVYIRHVPAGMFLLSLFLHRCYLIFRLAFSVDSNYCHVRVSLGAPFIWLCATSKQLLPCAVPLLQPKSQKQHLPSCVSAALAGVTAFFFVSSKVVAVIVKLILQRLFCHQTIYVTPIKMTSEAATVDAIKSAIKTAAD